MYRMAIIAQPTQRFINLINQQIETLKGEKQMVIDTLEHVIDQVLSEINVWVNDGHVNHTTYAEMNKRIQRVIHLFMEKSAEILDLAFEENENDTRKATSQASDNSTIPKMSCTRGDVKENMIVSREEKVHESGVDNNNTALKLAILERAVYSLKRTTKQIQEQQDHVKNNLELLNNANLNSEKKFQESIALLEKKGQEISSRVDHLFEDFGGKLTRLEEDNESAKASRNELNQQIRAVSTFSSESFISIQDLSKSVESTTQLNSEMSNKLDQLENSINLMSSHYTERFEAMCNFNKYKTDAFENSIENRVAKLTNKVAKLDRKCSLPNAGFYAWTSLEVKDGWCDVELFDSVPANYGDHFNSQTGKFTAPLNGLYLISIRTGSLEKNDSFGAVCYQKSNNPLPQRDDGGIELCDVVGNQTIVRCTELAAGDTVYLQSTNFEKSTTKYISVYFSIVMIKC